MQLPRVVCGGYRRPRLHQRLELDDLRTGGVSGPDLLQVVRPRRAVERVTAAIRLVRPRRSLLRLHRGAKC